MRQRCVAARAIARRSDAPACVVGDAYVADRLTTVPWYDNPDLFCWYSIAEGWRAHLVSLRVRPAGHDLPRAAHGDELPCRSPRSPPRGHAHAPSSSASSPVCARAGWWRARGARAAATGWLATGRGHLRGRHRHRHRGPAVARRLPARRGRLRPGRQLRLATRRGGASTTRSAGRSATSVSMNSPWRRSRHESRLLRPRGDHRRSTRASSPRWSRTSSSATATRPRSTGSGREARAAVDKARAQVAAALGAADKEIVFTERRHRVRQPGAHRLSAALRARPPDRQRHRAPGRHGDGALPQCAWAGR